MRQSVSSVMLVLAAVAILGTAVLHGMVNVPHLREDMVEIATSSPISSTPIYP